jgi:hypothetical protein
MWATSETLKNCPKMINQSLGENSPNLVTLVINEIDVRNFPAKFMPKTFFHLKAGLPDFS